jgi:hypothetical protein
MARVFYRLIRPTACIFESDQNKAGRNDLFPVQFRFPLRQYCQAAGVKDFKNRRYSFLSI